MKQKFTVNQEKIIEIAIAVYKEVFDALNINEYNITVTDEGIIIDTDDNSRFEELEGTGPVQEIQDPTDNLRIFGAKYPKRLFKDNEPFLHPITFNPRKIII